MKIRSMNGGLAALVLILNGLSFVSGIAQAGAYKWTDSSGQVHYSDQPPSDAARAVPGTSSKSDNSQAIKELAEKDQAFKQRQEEAAKAKEKAAKEAEQARTKRENCQKARDNFSQLQSSRRLYTQAPNGERLYMNDTDRQQALSTAQKHIKENCN